MPELPPVYFNKDTDSFAYSTARVRWVKIVQDAIDDVRSALSKGKDTDFQTQGEHICQELQALKNEIVHDGAITGFADDRDNIAYQCYNAQLKGKNYTWLTGPWLVLENYLYRVINHSFVTRSEWFNYDIFDNLKSNSFNESVPGVTELAVHYYQLAQQINSEAEIDDETLELLFREFAEISLWGNATDLSLLATASLESVQSIQGFKARKESEDMILTDDLDEAYFSLRSLPLASKRVDFVLDNSGFELFTDLIFGLFLIDLKLANKVVFHTKDIPWMVSDVNIKDFYKLLTLLRDESVFNQHRKELNFLINKLEYTTNNGTFVFKTSPFWTFGLDFYNITPSEKTFHGADVHQDLVDSSLVIFKGDLNYRKLTGDRRWPSTTPFVDSIGPLASEGLRILALRTVKADVIVGLHDGVYEQVTEEWAEKNENKLGWLSSGKYAVISYSNGATKK